MTTRNRIKTLVSFALVALMLFVQSAVAKQIPAHLPDPDGKAPYTTKPVKVYILAGQSNMVGTGQINGGSTRRGPQILEPIVSVYSGEYSPTADYDKLTLIKTKKLPVYGGVKPTPSPGGGTQVVRGFIKMKTSGVYEFKPHVRWGVIESNKFGTHEFIEFCRRLEAEPYICHNGLAGVQEMRDWVEYCNGKDGVLDIIRGFPFVWNAPCFYTRFGAGSGGGVWSFRECFF